MRLVQLEVITGNDPAIGLFKKLGFQETRELLIIRRPPMKLPSHLIIADDVRMKDIVNSQIPTYLAEREAGAAWTEESYSLLNAGGLKGIHITLDDGETGWIIFQHTPFQLTHFVFSPNTSIAMKRALIGAVHTRYPMQDTKIENVPREDPTWAVFQEYGYVESFSRIEMFLYL